MSDTLSVLKVVVEGAVTSFRYPHLTQGFQPTFEMPPPSTIYGHICSAAGNYVEVDGWYVLDSVSSGGMGCCEKFSGCSFFEIEIVSLSVVVE